MTASIRTFDFDGDTLAFKNELWWEYCFDPINRKIGIRWNQPAPTYAHQCFVLVRAVRQFYLHAQFEPRQAQVDDPQYYRLSRQVVARNPRQGRLEKIRIPGYPHLRAFSTAKENVLKTALGGAWQSYCLRSHWRIIFPFPRRHQALTAHRLTAQIHRGQIPVVHLVRFPKLTINHGLLLFGVQKSPEGFLFNGYDPNQPASPVSLRYNRGRRTFLFPSNFYWAGGRVDVLEILRNWLF